MAAKPDLKTLCGFSGNWTELNRSNKRLTAGCALLVANEVKNNESLEIITYGDEQAIVMKTIMTTADLSGKDLGASEAIILAAFLPKCQ